MNFMILAIPVCLSFHHYPVGGIYTVKVLNIYAIIAWLRERILFCVFSNRLPYNIHIQGLIISTDFVFELIRKQSLYHVR